jgi:hypothetical protein
LENADMNTQTRKQLHLPLLAGGIAAILVSSIAIGSLAVLPQGFNGVFAAAGPPEAAAAPAIAAPGASAYRCFGCGMIESARQIEASDEKSGVKASGRISAGNPGEIAGKPVGKYAITIRLQDGSLRVITDANPARWRPGERVTLIGGME